MRKPVLFTAFIAVFLCLLTTACGKKESSDVRPELTEIRNTLKSFQEQQSELERKITALEQLIKKNNNEVDRKTLESNKQGLEETLEELKKRITSLEERLSQLEQQTAPDKRANEIIGKWQWQADKEYYDREYVQGNADYRVFIFKKYTSKVANTGLYPSNPVSSSDHRSSEPAIGVKLIELNIQPGGKGYVRYQNTNPLLPIGQGETFQKDFTYEQALNGFFMVYTPNVFSDLEGAFLASPIYVLKMVYVPEIGQRTLAIAGLEYEVLHKDRDHSGWRWDMNMNNSVLYPSKGFYDWKPNSDGKYWELVSNIRSVEHRDDYLYSYSDEIFKANPSVAFVRK